MKKVIALLIPSLLAFSAASQATVMSIGDVAVNADIYTLNTDGSSAANIEGFVGLSSGTLNSLSTGTATDGAAIKDSFFINAGNTFSFDWNWFSSESASSGPFYNDFSFVSLSLDGIELLADTYTADNTDGSFSWTALTTGELTYGIGVLNVNDTALDSTLVVKNINVPEPTLFALFGLALAGFGLRRKRKNS